MRAGKDTTKIICTAEVIKSGRKLGFIATEIRDETSVLLAKADFVFCTID